MHRLKGLMRAETDREIGGQRDREREIERENECVSMLLCVWGERETERERERERERESKKCVRNAVRRSYRTAFLFPTAALPHEVSGAEIQGRKKSGRGERELMIVIQQQRPITWCGIDSPADNKKGSLT
jgi:hypothetical protein